MAEAIIFDPVNRFFWSTIIILLIACGVLYINRGYKRESKSEKKIMFGYAFIFFSIAISRLFIFISSYYIKGTYKEHVFFGSYQNNYSIFDSLIFYGYISWFVGLICFFFTLEFVLKRTYYIFTCTNLIFLILIVLDSSFFWFLTGLDILLFFVLFVKFSKETSIQFQNITAFLLVGYILFWLGYYLEIFIIPNNGNISPMLSVILFLLGALITISLIKMMEPLIILSLLFVIPIYIGLFNYKISLEFIFGFSVGVIIYFIMIGFAFVCLIRYLKSLEIAVESVEEGEKPKDFLTMITKLKPKKLTEEEITFYREQKLCLVCKNKVLGFTFICPECNALYCEKCARALSKVENSCWVCNSPFDKTKPVKKIQPEKEGEITVEKDIHKNLPKDSKKIKP